MQIKSQKAVLVLITSIFFGILPYKRLGFSSFYNSAVDLLKFYRLTVGDRKWFWTFILDFYAFHKDLLASIVTPVPLLQLLNLVFWLFNLKPCFRVPFSRIFRDSEHVDAAVTALRRVLQGAASPFWHAGWKHKHWLEYLPFSPAGSAAVAAGNTQVDSSGLLSFPAGPSGSPKHPSGSGCLLISTITQHESLGIRIAARFYQFCGSAKQNKLLNRVRLAQVSCKGLELGLG